MIPLPLKLLIIAACLWLLWCTASPREWRGFLRRLTWQRFRAWRAARYTKRLERTWNIRITAWRTWTQQGPDKD